MRVKIFESEQQFTLRLKSEENIFVLDWVWIWSCCALIIGGEWILCKNNKCNYFIIYLLVESDDNEFEQIFLPLENKKRILPPIKWQRKKKREYSIVFLYSQENFEVVSLLYSKSGEHFGVMKQNESPNPENYSKCTCSHFRSADCQNCNLYSQN